MPRFGSFTSAKSLTTSSRSRVTYIPPTLSYYRGVTEYTSGYTLTGISSLSSLKRSNPVKFGSKSGDIGTYVDGNTYRYVDFPITSIGNQFWAEMWHYTPSAFTSLNQSTSCFSLYNSSTLDYMSFYITYYDYSPYAMGFSRADPTGAGGSSHSVNTQRDTWHHLAWRVNGAGWTLYVDGVSWWGTNLLYANTAGTTFDRVTLGDSKYGVNALQRFYMDDFRLSSGLTRYTFASTITVPTAQLTADSDTTLLVNF